MEVDEDMVLAPYFVTIFFITFRWNILCTPLNRLK